MKKIIHICDNCGKEYNPDNIWKSSEIAINWSIVDSTKENYHNILELCNSCTGLLFDKLSEFKTIKDNKKEGHIYFRF